MTTLAVPCYLGEFSVTPRDVLQMMMFKQIGLVAASIAVGAALAVLVLDRTDRRIEPELAGAVPTAGPPEDTTRGTATTSELAPSSARVSVDGARDTASAVDVAQATADEAARSLSDVELEAIVRTQEPFAADDSTFEQKYASLGVEDLHRVRALVGRFSREEQDLVLPSVFASGEYSTRPERKNGGPDFYRITAAPDGQQVKVYFDPLVYPFIEMRAREQSWLIMRIRALGGDPGKYNTSRTRG